MGLQISTYLPGEPLFFVDKHRDGNTLRSEGDLDLRPSIIEATKAADTSPSKHLFLRPRICR